MNSQSTLRGGRSQSNAAGSQQLQQVSFWELLTNGCSHCRPCFVKDEVTEEPELNVYEGDFRVDGSTRRQDVGCSVAQAPITAPTSRAAPGSGSARSGPGSVRVPHPSLLSRESDEPDSQVAVERPARDPGVSVIPARDNVRPRQGNAFNEVGLEAKAPIAKQKDTVRIQTVEAVAEPLRQAGADISNPMQNTQKGFCEFEKEFESSTHASGAVVGDDVAPLSIPASNSVSECKEVVCSAATVQKSHKESAQNGLEEVTRPRLQHLPSVGSWLLLLAPLRPRDDVPPSRVAMAPITDGDASFIGATSVTPCAPVTSVPVTEEAALAQFSGDVDAFQQSNAESTPQMPVMPAPVSVPVSDEGKPEPLEEETVPVTASDSASAATASPALQSEPRGTPSLAADAAAGVPRLIEPVAAQPSERMIVLDGIPVGVSIDVISDGHLDSAVKVSGTSISGADAAAGGPLPSEPLTQQLPAHAKEQRADQKVKSEVSDVQLQRSSPRGKKKITASKKAKRSAAGFLCLATWAAANDASDAVDDTINLFSLVKDDMLGAIRDCFTSLPGCS